MICSLASSCGSPAASEGCARWRGGRPVGVHHLRCPSRTSVADTAAATRARRDRKRAIEQLLARTALQDAEENVILEQAVVVEGARRAEAAARKAAAAPPRPCAL